MEGQTDVAMMSALLRDAQNERDHWKARVEAAGGQEPAHPATETGAEAEKVLPDPARVARHAIANYYTSDGVKWRWSCVCGVGDTVEFVSAHTNVGLGILDEVGGLLAKAALERHLEQAALVAERDELRAEVERLREELDGAMATVRHQCEGMSWIAGHDRQGLDHLRESIEATARAEAAEAKVARVEALIEGWKAGGGSVVLDRSVEIIEPLRAAIADAPAEQRAGGAPFSRMIREGGSPAPGDAEKYERALDDLFAEGDGRG